jgi:hypothetical protein
MIILSTLLITLLIAMAGIVVKLVFKVKWPWMNRIVIGMLALSLVFGAAAGIASATTSASVSRLETEYDNIMLYYNTVSNSPNEYVRFDFYNRVNEFNANYENVVEQSKSSWIGAFFDKDWSNRIAPIVFELHGDEYYAG